MTRRGWLHGLAAVPAALGAQVQRPRIVVEEVALRLRHTWTTTMSSSDERRNVFLRHTRDGITGIGEGAPIVRYGENAYQAKDAAESLISTLGHENPLAYVDYLREAFRRLTGQYAARAAIDISTMDWVGQKHGIPLYRLFGLDPAKAPITTFSIGIDKPEVVRQKVREAEVFPVLKIKVGLDNDEETIGAVRAETDKPLRVDANEGWKDKETALRKIRWLESQGVEIVEQPMPAEMIEETRWLRGRVNIPLMADEACRSITDIPKLAEAYDAVNVKLSKSAACAKRTKCCNWRAPTA
jgi:L-Ala-D/L-Glu epimerase